MAELDGFEAMITALRRVSTRTQNTTPGALAKAAHEVEKNAKALLSLTSHPYGTPTPSSPGSPPSLVSGHLRRSVQVNGSPAQNGPGSWSIDVLVLARYARVQELGGGPSHLPARPYMEPALMTSLPRIEQIMTTAWARALQT